MLKIVRPSTFKHCLSFCCHFFFFSLLPKPVGQVIVQWQRKTYSLDIDLGIPASSSHSFITFSLQAIPWGCNFDQQSKRYRTASEKKGQMLLLYMKLKFCWLLSQIILYSQLLIACIMEKQRSSQKMGSPTMPTWNFVVFPL